MAKHNLLFVDDEPYVLKAVSRIFRKENDYTIYTATSGKEGLEFLGKHPVSLIISDHKMPEMTGVEFLTEAKKLWPNTLRIMLTGYADIKSATEAINTGEIYRYITKPWEDLELLTVIKQALGHYELVENNKKLHELTKTQNLELKDLNQNLENKVIKRTQIITEKKDELNRLYKDLEKNFFDSVRVFVDVLDLYNPLFGNHSRRTALLSRLVATNLGCNQKQGDDVELAAMLHDIGMIGIPQEISTESPESLSPNKRTIYEQHPVIGQNTLAHIKKLEPVGTVIRAHHERYDGKGFPDGLEGKDIPMDARIIAVADFYDFSHTCGLPWKDNPTTEDVINAIKENRGSVFDPKVVEHFLLIINSIRKKKSKEKMVPIESLRPGMVISRDINTLEGFFLIAKGTILNDIYISKIKNYQKVGYTKNKIFIYCGGP